MTVIKLDNAQLLRLEKNLELISNLKSNYEITDRERDILNAYVDLAQAIAEGVQPAGSMIHVGAE